MSAELSGFKELERTFKTLGERTQRRVLRSAVSAATTPIVRAAKANANDSKESGTLKKSLGRKIKTYVEAQTVVGIIGPRTDVVGEWKGKKRWPAKYAHLVEGGHVDQYGNYIQPKPFLRPAYEATEGQAINVMSSKLAEGVTREASKVS